MATVLGSLLVSLGLESAEFDRGLDKARKGMRRAGKDFDKESDRMYRAGHKIGSSIKGIGTAAVAAGFGYISAQLQNAAEGSLEFASSLGETAQQLGVTSEALQEYRYAATQAGISQEEMDKALAQLTRRIGEAANGTKAQADAFKSLGISVKDANGNVLSAADAIPMVADALKGIENPAQRAAALTDLFGKAGQKLEPLLSGGSAAVNELRSAAHKLGAVLSEDQIQKADETADKLAAINLVLKAKIAGAVTDNADAILALGNAFASLVGWIGQATNAYRQWRQDNAIKMADNTANGWFSSGQAKAEARRQAGQLREQQANDLLARNGLTLDAIIEKPKPTAAFAAGYGSTGPSKSGGKSAQDIARQAAQNAASFNDELRQLQVDLQQAEAEYTGNIKQALAAKMAALDADLEAYRQSTALDEDLTAARRAALLAAKESLVAQEKLLAEQEYGRSIADQTFEVARGSLQVQLDDAQLRAELAGNAQDRLDAELAILDLQDRLRLAELDRILAVEATASAAWENAARERDALIASKGARTEAVKRNNEGPGQAFLREIDKSTGQMREAFEQTAVDGLKALNDGLTEAVVNFRSLGDVASAVFKQILADIMRMQIQKSIIKPLAAMLGLAGSTPSIGGALKNVGGQLSAIGTYKPLPGFASGTKFAPGGLAIVGERGPEIVNLRAGSQVIPNHELNGIGGTNVQVIPSPYFDVVVNGHIQRAAPTIAGLGASEASARMARSNTRRIG